MIEWIDVTLLPLFLLVFARTIAFFISVPLFSYRTIPTPYKIGFSFFLSIAIVSTLDRSAIDINSMFFLLLLKEIVVGLMIGFVAYMILVAVQIAGGFIDFQMGFLIANVIDPQTGAQSPLTGQYFYIFALLFLLVVDGHYLIIDGLFHSYQFIPVDGMLYVKENFGLFIIKAFNTMFLIAFQIAIPLVGCLFLVDVALGMIARTVPQLNVFVVGLPLKIGISFIIMFFFLSLYMTIVKMLFATMLETMRMVMELLGGA
jgi:flagellar biosynthetic protein FliR